MKKWIKKSFHRQLLVCFGVVALLPLLLFGVFLIQTMETKINSDYEKKVTEQAEQIDAGILELFQEFEMVVENINANTRIVEQIGEDDTWSKSKIYLQFYREVADYREYAQFDLYDKNGKCIYTTAQGSAKTDLPVYWGILKAVEDSKETLVLRRADTNDSKILLYAAGKLMGKDGIPEGYIVISMLTISVILCVLVASRLGRNMTRPIERMNTAMRTLQEGDLTVRIVSDREDELGQMSRNFNIMANELEQSVQDKVEKQKELNASHIAMMQAQLNPHFLYNTLDTMKWVAKANHIPEIATMAAGLAKILRTSISKRQFIYLKEELELVNCYVDIQKIRFNDKFSYTVDLQEGLEECVIPKLIIQPIVENSVLHGLKESEEGNILVRITGQEDVLCIEVTDDGCGAPEERIDAINHRRQEQLVGHIGVSNVDTIIRLTYGEEYGIHMESLTSHAEIPTDGQRTEEEGEVHGTKVTLRLPVRYGEA